MSKIIDSVLRSTLEGMLKLVTEDQRMHFNKIHRGLGELDHEQIVSAINLVDRTLKQDGIDYLYNGPNFIKSEEAGGML